MKTKEAAVSIIESKLKLTGTARVARIHGALQLAGFQIGSLDMTARLCMTLGYRVFKEADNTLMVTH